MTEVGRPSRVRPRHWYPPLPPEIDICDDEAAGGNHFFFRKGELVVHRDDHDWVEELMAAARDIPEYRFSRSPVGAPLELLSFGMVGVDTVAVQRRLRAAEISDDPTPAAERWPSDGAGPGTGPARPGSRRDPPRVWFNHALGRQSHMNYGSGTPPRPRPRLSPLPVGHNLPGRDVRVGVLDTGIEDDPWFAGRWTPVHGKDRSAVAEFQPNLPPPFEVGHGSFLAGLVLQHAPGAQVVVDRLDDSYGCFDDWGLQRQLAHLLDPANKIDVLNLSFGGYTSDNGPLPVVGELLAGALDARPELVVVACAGNDAVHRRLWPAAQPRVIGVGALDRAGTDRWRKSNRGEWVSAWSIGEDLSSRFIRWPRGWRRWRPGAEPGPWGRPGPAAYRERFRGWARWSGTSFATARVSGAIAAELKRDGRSPRRVVFDLVRNAPVQFESGGIVEPATFVT